MADEQLERFERIVKDPWEFLKGVFTIDQVDRECPIKKFPCYLEYLELYTRIWHKEPKLLVPKSRRMKLSWINICLYTWDTAFNVGRHNAFISKKEEDSDELVQRSVHILENYDKELLPRELIPKYKKTFNMLEFPELSSKIQGFPSGADQLRQFTLSGILADEMAFWDDAELMYANSLPTLEGGGRFTGISSVAPSFFEKLVFDRLDEEQSDSE